jgi:antitoxin YefM
VPIPIGTRCWPSAARRVGIHGSKLTFRDSAADVHRRPREIAILLAMSMAEQLPLADVKNRLSEVVDRVQREHDRVVITKHGRPAAVIVSVEDLESLEETLEILSDPTLLKEIRDAELERSKSLTTKLSKDEVLARTRTQ